MTTIHLTIYENTAHVEVSEGSLCTHVWIHKMTPTSKKYCLLLGIFNDYYFSMDERTLLINNVLNNCFTIICIYWAVGPIRCGHWPNSFRSRLITFTVPQTCPNHYRSEGNLGNISITIPTSDNNSVCSKKHTKCSQMQGSLECAQFVHCHGISCQLGDCKLDWV